MTELDKIALSIELVLISVVEAAALTFLAESSIPLLHDADHLMYLPYIVSGLVLILVFWSQSILHAVSFIRWPLRLGHMFLYFVAAFIQIIAYSNLVETKTWFFWMSTFSIVAILLYIIDLRVIKDSRHMFLSFESGQDFMDEVERRHRYEMHVLVPLALAFNVLAFLALLIFPTFFEADAARFVLGLLSALISLGALYDCVANFNNRSGLIEGLLQ